jgi:hypothetical protein
MRDYRAGGTMPLSLPHSALFYSEFFSLVAIVFWAPICNKTRTPPHQNFRRQSYARAFLLLRFNDTIADNFYKDSCETTS